MQAHCERVNEMLQTGHVPERSQELGDQKGNDRKSVHHCAWRRCLRERERERKTMGTRGWERDGIEKKNSKERERGSESQRKSESETGRDRDQEDEEEEEEEEEEEDDEEEKHGNEDRQEEQEEHEEAEQ